MGNASETDERIEVVVRIPERVAKNLAGPERRPSVFVCEVYRRVENIALEAVGPPAGPGVITVGPVVDSSIAPTVSAASNFKDQDGAESCIL